MSIANKSVHHLHQLNLLSLNCKLLVSARNLTNRFHYHSQGKSLKNPTRTLQKVYLMTEAIALYPNFRFNPDLN